MSIELYCDHFGFSSRPFSLSPDPDFIFWSRSHTRAFSILQYGLVTRAPLTVVTGEVGTGKSTLVQALLRQLEDDTIVGLISNAQGSRDDLLRWVMNALSISGNPEDNYVALFQRFQDFVVDAYADGKHVVLIIDEAQNLGVETLEELRMFTNINSGKDELLQLILVGQPELRALILRPELRQFAQRVTSTYHINPLDRQTISRYIDHRLKAVGGTGAEIEEAAIDKIAILSKGIPRIINKICDLSFVYAASEDNQSVSAGLIDELIRDGVLIETSAPPLFLTERVETPRKAAE